MNAPIAHYYLYAPCKTPGCASDLLLMHLEAPDTPHLPIDYPDESLYLTLRCPGCGHAHSFTPQDVRTKSSVMPLHDLSLPLPLPFPPRKPPKSHS